MTASIHLSSPWLTHTDTFQIVNTKVNGIIKGHLDTAFQATKRVTAMRIQTTSAEKHIEDRGSLFHFVINSAPFQAREVIPYLIFTRKICSEKVYITISQHKSLTTSHSTA